MHARSSAFSRAFIMLALLAPIVGTESCSSSPTVPEPIGQSRAAVLKSFAAGSLIIPMDTTYQNLGMFKAYGLVYQLGLASVPVQWAVSPAKVAGGKDFTASSTNYQTGTVITAYDYRGGPFIIDSADAAAAKPIIDKWLLTNVTTVHRATATFSADIARTLTAAPRIAVFIDGNEIIAFNYLNAAGIPDSKGVAWPAAPSPTYPGRADILAPASIDGPTTTNHADGALMSASKQPAFCNVTSMHYNNAGHDPEVIAEVRSWLGNTGTHLYAECEAVGTFENDPASGHMLSTAGFAVDVQPAAAKVNAPTNPFAQFDGTFGTVNGAIPSFRLTGGSLYAVDSLLMQGSAAVGTNQMLYLTGYLDGVATKGKVSYLGGHAYNTALPITANNNDQGTRLFLNGLIQSPCTSNEGQPTLSLTASAPATTTVPTVTFTINYSNTGPGIASSAVITDALPPGATFVSATGGGAFAGGTVTWNLGDLGTTASGTVTVTVALPSPGTYTNQGKLTYNVGTTTKTLSSNTTTTVYGACFADADCTSAQFCDTAAKACVPKLTNGTAIPTIGGHAPPLTGACNAPVATSVCKSAVCDAADNKCGYANGDGSCSAATGVTVCRSAVCDPDGKCGFANGDGPCTAGSAATVCRSGACSTSGVCVPAGSCLIDADCASTQYCDNSISKCVGKLANNTAIPTISGHAPPLTGACTPGAGTAVCQSAVCDVDNRCGYANGDGTCTGATGGTVCRSAVCDPDGKCGFANGDGPCTVGSAPTVCRSGSCSSTGVCQPVGACAVDTDCAATQFCNTASKTCTPKLGNGTPVPTIAGHAPPLTGACSAPVASSVCQSGVCDPTDNACGYANGDGSCSVATAGTVCRSGVCDPDGKCGLANGDGPCSASSASTVCRSKACSTSGVCAPSGGCLVDGDCTSSNFCDTGAHLCTPKLANGTPVPAISGHAPPLTGTCTVAEGNVVCISGVCDTADNACGFANGHGTCDDVSGPIVCRSGTCVAGVCGPPSGDTGIDGGDAGTDSNVDALTDTSVDGADTADAGADAIADGDLESSSDADDGGADGAIDVSSDAIVTDASDDATIDDGAVNPDDASSVAGGGCNCTVEGAAEPPSALLGFGAVGLVLALARRRRARGREV